ncbi:MAG: TfoX/Sxy family protein [Henriciella sp.]|nr:TfoX/Sxy family protein [Henriciella sp.]
MKSCHPFYDYVGDLFAALGQIRIRKMFGGAGVYSGEDMFALLDRDQIYLKTDEALKSALMEEGGSPFEWTNPKSGKTMVMSYVSMPAEAMDDADQACAWARKALAVALRARQTKVKSPRRRPL